MSITNWSIRHSVTVLVLIAVLIIVGLVSYISLPRESFPDVAIPYVMVSTVYVGVSPADMEKLVTKPIEDELEQLKDVRKVQSSSSDGFSMIAIEFEPDVDIENALQKVRERVDAAKPELPSDLTDDPQVTEISFEDFPIMIVNISGDLSITQLMQNAEALQDRLEKIDGVLEVEIIGDLEREISVEADPSLLRYYNVSLGELMMAIQSRNLNMPGGTVELGTLNFPVRVPGEFEHIAEIESVVIRREGNNSIRVKDVAKVIDTWKDPSTYSRVSGQNSLSVSVTRRSGENILRVAEDIKAVVAEFDAANGGRIHYTIVGDISNNIRDMVHELENNIITGLLFVVVVLLFFMGGARNAVFVAIAIPMSMLISFAILSALGITLNMVVLFALVLALGMLVDNAIVIVENIYRHANMGKALTQAAMEGTAEVAWPVIASTATTVFAFAPLLFWPGIMGEFMYYLPLTVIVVLVSSLFVALVINPVICALFMRVKGKTTEQAAEQSSELDALPKNIIYGLYGWLLGFSLKHRWLVGLGVIGSFVVTFMLFGKFNAGVEFFPETTPERMYVNVQLPEGANVDESDRIVRIVEKALAKEENIRTWVANVGSGNGDFFSGGGASPHLSQITAEFLDDEDRIEDPRRTMDRLREALAGVVGAEIELVNAEGGPPTGAAVNIEIVGRDFDELGRQADAIKALIEDVDGLVNLRDDFESGRSEVSVEVNAELASLAGLSTQSVANEVRMAVNGVEASKFRDEEDEYDIIVRLQESSRDSVEDIANLYVKNSDGEYVPISEVAQTRVTKAFGSIGHIDGDRVVTVSGDASDSTTDAELLAAVKEKMAAEYEPPPGYEVRFTGQDVEQQQAQAFLGKALMVALFLIMLVLVTQFNSISQPFMILFSVVLSLLGVLWILMARQLPFGIIMTGVGVFSLAGVVVNNSIVLIDYTNQLRQRGLSVREAVFTAGMVRFRPVLLTAITTILSLMPIVMGFSLDAKEMRVVYGGTSVEFWGSMANAVVAGLVVATGLTLIVVPVMYDSLESFKGLMARLFRRKRRPKASTESSLAKEALASHLSNPSPDES